MALLNHASASVPADAAVRCDSHRSTGVCACGSGIGTVRVGRSGAVTVRPFGVTVGSIRTSRLTSRAVMTAPASSTSIQRRSPASPQGSTTSSGTDSPRHDLTG